jgi:FkbM family methyltransferase
VPTADNKSTKCNMQKTSKPFPLLWHPHQKLWNWALVRRLRRIAPTPFIHKLMCFAVVILDTQLLFFRALTTRLTSLGFPAVFRRAQVPDDISILYLDVGTHRDAFELDLVVNAVLPRVCSSFDAYGFEANHESFEHAARKFAMRQDVTMINKALVRTVPSGGKIKLFKDMANGLGDSLYREGSEYQEVECERLSEFLVESDLLQTNRIVLLRMNIEGAEYDVLRDLVESGLHKCVDGYFGMWDDVSKIDIDRDNEFRAFLMSNGIDSFTFNGRDMSHASRRVCIVYHLHTRIMEGFRRVRSRRGLTGVHLGS